MTLSRVDLKDGTWQRKNNHLLEVDERGAAAHLQRTTLAGDLNES